MGVRIIINNNKCRIECGVPLLKTIREHGAFSLRVSGAFFSPAYRRGSWDGKFHMITARGIFDTGKLPQLLGLMKTEFNTEYTLVDERPLIYPKNKVIRLQNYTFRPYQQQAVESVGKSKLDGLPFPICNINAATNAGKTLVSAGIHKMYESKTLFIINSKDLLEEALREIPDYLPDQVGFVVSGQKTVWKPFMIVMVKTMINRIKDDHSGAVIKKLQEYKVCLVDEADLATSKTYQTILSTLYHCPVRVGLSGTLWVYRKDKVKTEKLRALFGQEVFTISNQDLIKLGHSSDVKVNIFEGNTTEEVPGNFRLEYDAAITKNLDRHKKIMARVKLHASEGTTPLLIFGQYHEHIENLYKVAKKMFGKKYTVDWVHHERKDRQDVVRRFRDGEIDILIGSQILKRGKNFPLTKCIINASGGYSFTTVLQGPIGRAVRAHESKEFTVVEDIWDEGFYLKRHSRRRIAAYKGEEFNVRLLYKNKK